MIRVAQAFIRRDLLNSISYRVSFLLQFGGILVQVVLYFYIAQVFGGTVSRPLQPYGGNYFAFLLIGIAFTDYLSFSLSTFSGSIREGQTNGTLEVMLLSPTSLPAILLSASLWGYLFTTLRVLLYLVAGVAFFGLDLAQANIVSAAAFMLASMVAYGSVGIIAASLIMIVKKGDPLVWAFSALSTFLSGVYYPTAVLPDWMQMWSRFFPLTYSLNGMRLALLQGQSVTQALPDLLPLIAFAVILLPLGLWSFHFAVRRAKIEGSLAQY